MAPGTFQMWIAGDFALAVLLHGGQEQAETRTLRQTEAGKSGLPVASDVSPAADPVILIGDQKAVIRVAQKAQTPDGGRCGGPVVEQQTERLFRAAPDASAKLVELGQTEAFGLFDDHDGGSGDIHAHFDDGRSDEEARFAETERVQRVLTDGDVLFAVRETHKPLKALLQ